MMTRLSQREAKDLAEEAYAKGLSTSALLRQMIRQVHYASSSTH